MKIRTRQNLIEAAVQAHLTVIPRKGEVTISRGDTMVRLRGREVTQVILRSFYQHKLSVPQAAKLLGLGA